MKVVGENGAIEILCIERKEIALVLHSATGKIKFVSVILRFILSKVAIRH